MPVSKKLFWLGTAASITAALLASCSQQDTNQTDFTASAGAEWPLSGGSWSNNRYSTLDQIDTTNVAQLGGAWFHAFDSQSSRSTPVVSDGRMFIAASTSLLALDPATGETLWEFAPEGDSFGTKGVAVGEGKVFFALSGARLGAVDQATGELLWTANVGDDPALRGQAVSNAPTYVDGLVITGMANGDFGFRGRVSAYDSNTGERKWEFYTIPGPGEAGHDTWPQDNDEWERGGGGVWVVPAVDKELGLVYISVGNPVPQYGGEMRAGDNLYSDSVVALDYKTGEVAWHFQTTHHDIWEADLGTPPILFDGEVAGVEHKGLGIFTTYGHLFMFDRATGEPIWPVEERPVPQHERLLTSPTQPFPVGADKMGGDECTEPNLIPEGFQAMCMYEPIDYDLPNAMYPILTTRQAPAAYSPETGHFYATGANWPFWMKRFEDPDYFVAVPTGAGVKYEGLLAAMDSKTNTLAWEHVVPFRTQQNGSGFMVTAGGLLFHGETDGYMKAYSAETGEQLWQFQTGSSANNSSSTYEVDGVQYVANTSSGGVWAFKLNGAVAELPAPPTPPTETSFAGRIMPTNEISLSAEVGDTGLVDEVRMTHDEYAIEPMRARVSVGESVTFTNNGEDVHSATALDGSWTTGLLRPGQSKTLTFDKPGVYTYQCDRHKFSYAELTVDE